MREWNGQVRKHASDVVAKDNVQNNAIHIFFVNILLSLSAIINRLLCTVLYCIRSHISPPVTFISRQTERGR